MGKNTKKNQSKQSDEAKRRVAKTFLLTVRPHMEMIASYPCSFIVTLKEGMNVDVQPATIDDQKQGEREVYFIRTESEFGLEARKDHQKQNDE